MRKWLAYGIVILVVLTGCKTRYITTEVPVVVEHTTTHHHTDVVRDTLLQRDSVYHYVMGDTTIIERWHHVVDVHNTLIRDTVRDTVPVVTERKVTEIKTVNHMHWWQKALAWIGTIASIAACIMIIRKFTR